MVKVVMDKETRSAKVSVHVTRKGKSITLARREFESLESAELPEWLEEVIEGYRARFRPLQELSDA